MSDNMLHQTVAANLSAIRERIRAAGGTETVSILPVTKTFGPDAIEAVRAAGYSAIGENYAQELRSKADACHGLDVYFIGQLQTNKVKMIADTVSVFGSVDRLRLGSTIIKRRPGARMLVQVDTSHEPGKGGCPLADVPALVEALTELGANVEGLMTVGPTEGGPAAARAGFEQVRALCDRLGLTTCSMGMSGDLEVAVETGSTQVRIGRSIFGARPVLNAQGAKTNPLGTTADTIRSEEASG